MCQSSVVVHSMGNECHLVLKDKTTISIRSQYDLISSSKWNDFVVGERDALLSLSFYYRNCQNKRRARLLTAFRNAALPLNREVLGSILTTGDQTNEYFNVTTNRSVPPRAHRAISRGRRHRIGDDGRCRPPICIKPTRRT
ncbi:hypothetical protein EVAR_94048_1 [Eumeta japonica]|uniref:Uncharacterized protein n=1 Tax=Eumeta variegata TaxID=151549 RepID=A0A4C1V6K4_EUMVA|nr:hypothetical protein EVAR_94048_1 [Eumeta japonica]